MPAAALRRKHDGRWFILATPLAGSDETFAIGIDPYSGALIYSRSKDGGECKAYPNPAQARKELLRGEEPREEVRCGAIVGYVAAAAEASLLVVTQADETARLPGWPREHVVRTVVSSRWIRIPLVDVMLQFSGADDLRRERCSSPSPASRELSPQNPALDPQQVEMDDPGLGGDPGAGAAAGTVTGGEGGQRFRRRVRTGDARRDRESAALQVLGELQLDGHHFWCDSFDLTHHWLDRPCGDSCSAEPGGARLRDVAHHSHHHLLPRDPPPAAGAPPAGSNQRLWDAANPEFVWNARLSEPFKEVGLQFCCVTLLRGLCCSNVLSQTGSGSEVVCTLVTRQRNLNPGSRLEARGLHPWQGPGVGNEYECEQLLYHRLAPAADGQANWARPEGVLKLPKSCGPPKLQRQPTERPKEKEKDREKEKERAAAAEKGEKGKGQGPGAPAQPAAEGRSRADSCGVQQTAELRQHLAPDDDQAVWSWAYYCWSRGTVPLRWAQSLRHSTDVSATIVIDKEPYQGVADYWQRVWERYGTDAFYIVNLLRNMLPGHVGTSQAPDFCAGGDFGGTPIASPRHNSAHSSPMPSPRAAARASVASPPAGPDSPQAESAEAVAAEDAAAGAMYQGSFTAAGLTTALSRVVSDIDPVAAAGERPGSVEADPVTALAMQVLGGSAPPSAFGDPVTAVAIAEAIGRLLVASEECAARGAHGDWLLAAPGRPRCKHSGWLERTDSRKRKGRLWFELLEGSPPVLRCSERPAGPEVTRLQLSRGAAGAAVVTGGTDESGSGFPFVITSAVQKRSWHLVAPSLEERQEWVDRLAQTIGAARERARTQGIDAEELDRQLGIERGYGKELAAPGDEDWQVLDDDDLDDDLGPQGAEGAPNPSGELSPDTMPADARRRASAIIGEEAGAEEDDALERAAPEPTAQGGVRSGAPSPQPRPLKGKGARGGGPGGSGGGRVSPRRSTLTEQGVTYKGEPLLGYWFELSLHALDRYLERQQRSTEGAASPPLPQRPHVPGDPPQFHRTELRHVDWHGSVKRNGERRTVDTLWKECAPRLRAYGVSSGLYYRVPHGGGQAAAPRLRVDSLQRGVLRFNCADSLDRTNLGCFSASLHALTEQYRALALAPELRADDCDGAEPPPLPPAAQNGMEGDEWCLLMASHEAALKELSPALLGAHAASFVCNGDVCAMCYCNSPAMHSGLLRSFAGEALQQKGQSNFAIALKRRYANQFTDRRRTRSINMLLGRDWMHYLPTAWAPARFPRITAAEARCAVVLIEAIPEAGLSKGAQQVSKVTSRRDVAASAFGKGSDKAPQTLLHNGPQMPFWAMYKASSAPSRPAVLAVYASQQQAEEAVARLTADPLALPQQALLTVHSIEYCRYYETWWQWLHTKEDGAGQRARQIFTDVRSGLAAAAKGGFGALKALGGQRWRK
eukprot:TRINITY_DN2629_c1_g3_i1.p1 TRINITY_DN2629_c1_g3~~TRINITY_DN2629_c1_g3_i1.p1  ORF type:complete len:1428 (+),score=372.36 TRINITY_DN2629_c1_g3_i1:81-4364(+)